MFDQGRVLPDGWEIRTLESLAANVTSGGTPTSGDPRYYTEADGLPFAKTEDLTRAKGKHLSDCELQITDAALKASAAKRYPVGSILVSMYGTIGLTKITVRELAANQALSALLPPFECDPVFLYHQLEFIRPRWSRYSGQTTQANISGAIVRAATVAAPPRAEQSAIARILDTLDTQIEKTQALIAKLEQVKEGLLHDLLTRGVDESGELRPSAEEAPDLYKASPLGLIPREWDVRPIGAMAERVTNGFVGVATPHYVPPGRGIAYLYGNNVRANRIEIDNVLHVSRSFHQAQSKSQLRQGDMLTVQSGHIGTTAVFDGSLGEANCHALIITRFKSRDIEPRFVALYLNSWHGMRRQGSLFVGSTILHINTSDLAKLHVPVPSIDEQLLCVRRAESIQTRIDAEKGMRRKLLSHKSGLMDDLLTGRVRVTQLLDPQEAASTV